MVKQIIWSKLAQKDRKSILEYWNNHNKSKIFSIKLNQLFIDTLELISKYPEIGKKTQYPEVRVKIVEDYLITYQEFESRIEVLTIWDSRQQPEKFERTFKV